MPSSRSQARSIRHGVASRRLTYQLLTLADAAQLSRFQFCYDAREPDPLRVGEALPGLDQVVPVEQRFEMLLLPPLPEGWKRIGIASQREPLTKTNGKKGPTRLVWMLVFEWETSRSAWQALLEAQELLHPRGVSLSPDLIIPAFFLASGADAPLASGTGRATAWWRPILAQVQEDLSLLIQAWYLEWMLGTSDAAQKYRQLSGASPKRHPDTDDVLATFGAWFSDALLKSLQAAERPEPIILRGLVEASAQLWSKERVIIRPSPVPVRRRALMIAPEEQLRRGLLPLTYWKSPELLPAEFDVARVPTSGELLKVWELWRTRTMHSTSLSFVGMLDS